MIDTILNAALTALSEADIDAVRSFPEAALDETKPLVCVSVKSLRLSSCGCGDYIGISGTDGNVTDLYGSKAEFCLSFDVYSYSSDAAAIVGKLYEAIMYAGKMSIKGFESEDTKYDPDSNMFVTHCEIKALSLLVRYESNMRQIFAPEV